MKITICGKGGSGKSTVTALLAKEYAAKGKKVLVIDCDESNYGLHQQLGMDIPLSLTDYMGGKMKILDDLAEGPQNMPMLFDEKWTLLDIPQGYFAEKDGIMLMTPGKIQTANEACACAFSVVMCQFMQVLDLTEDEIVIMDMEAGIEHFGRGVDNASDVVIMVIDPSRESIKLASKISEIGSSIGKPVYYVLNKVTNDTLDIVRSGIADKENICCELPMSQDIMKAGLIGSELQDGNDAIVSMKAYLEKHYSA